MVGVFSGGRGGSSTGSGSGGATTGLFRDVSSPVDKLFSDGGTNQIVFLSVCEHERHKRKNITKISIRGKGGVRSVK